jgi:hypothetical protein
MGEALMKMDDAQKALEHLLAVSRPDPLKVTVHYRLSVLYREIGRESEAHRELVVLEKLQESKKKIQQVYQKMHELVPEKDVLPSDVPRVFSGTGPSPPEKEAAIVEATLRSKPAQAICRFDALMLFD